jgi:hypothetical protein
MSNEGSTRDLDKIKTVVEITWLAIRIVGAIATAILVSAELIGAI